MVNRTKKNKLSNIESLIDISAFIIQYWGTLRSVKGLGQLSQGQSILTYSAVDYPNFSQSSQRTDNQQYCQRIIDFLQIWEEDIIFLCEMYQIRQVRIYKVKTVFMQSQFSNREIVWAKVKGYPWWPAEVAKLPTPDNNVFKVVFIAEDTHAYLNPKDVKKYSQFYDECSKKKMRGLGSAIQAADQLFKKRSDSLVKDNHPSNKSEPKSPAKSKQIKKRNKKKPRQQSDGEGQQLQKIEEQVSQQIHNQKMPQPVEVNQQQNFSEQEEASQQQENSSEQESISQERFLNQSSEKVDRTKIDTIQQEIYRHLEQIRQRNYHFSIQHFTKISFDNLTDEELLQSKITNMLSFIIHELKKQFCFPQSTKETIPKDHHFTKQREELKHLINIQKKLKERIINYLNDTSYYDQYLRLIQKNKKNRHDYQSRLVSCLKQSYKIKKQLAQIFATRLMSQINNGAIVKSKQLLQDLRERKVEMGNVNNRAVIDRIIESMTSKYI